ncbi:MAG: DUF3883 domain-containing protein [Clostridiaceae bacterium]|nr:DUF3883 domain-containing protein [Clostridiaceae bacterium]
MYTIPLKYFYRLHHVRPRFKGDIENVLIYIATEIAKLPQQEPAKFKESVNAAIRLFPGNMQKKIKTINNWRTEISSLFGFIQKDNSNLMPGRRAYELAENQDLIESFKVFLFNFQYPGGHIKPHETLKMVQVGINFKPAKYIIQLLQYAEKAEGRRIGISKPELTHCIFNDLRCTRDAQPVDITWGLIKKNRDINEKYDCTGDIIRYAGDILDYMEIANLLVTHDNKHYFLNTLETEAILKFVNSNEWFSGYDDMLGSEEPQLEKIVALQEEWYRYVNREIEDTDFQTDILALISADTQEYTELKKASFNLLREKIDSAETLATKDIGDIGESLVHGHECERIRIGGREDLIHLIKRIPTQFAVGYDIQSVELDAKKRYIEVKTTISSKPLHFNKVHLTPNEWNTADTMKDRYFVYRLMVSKLERKLFIIQDPVGQYKNDKIQMIPRDGADIIFDINTSGDYEELLSWVN